MMDPSRVIPKGFHFVKWESHDGVKFNLTWRDRWSVRPVPHYFIDFGVSSRYPAEWKDIIDYGIFGQDKTVPEMSLTVPYDPFKMDVYQLGNAIIEVAEVRHEKKTLCSLPHVVGLEV